MISALSDQSTGAEWGCDSESIGGTSTDFGTGAANTIKIVAECEDIGYAAKICSNLVLGGYSDWFLPSHDELKIMYEFLKLQGYGNFANVSYWSSSEGWGFWSPTWAYGYDFLNGTNTAVMSPKSILLHVRAIRAF